MRYCPKCQALVQTEAACPSCGSKKLREVQANDPVLLYTADEIKCSMIRAAFDDNGIPHEERMCGPGAPPSILYGKMPSSLYRIYVPFDKVDCCEEILQGIGALGERKQETDAADGKPILEPTENSGKATFYRIIAAILFLGLIYAVVNLADSVIAFLQSAFH